MFFKNKRNSPEKAKDETSPKKAGFGIKLEFKKPKLPKIFGRKKRQQKNMEDLCSEINNIIIKMEMLDEIMAS